MPVYNFTIFINRYLFTADDFFSKKEIILINLTFNKKYI